MDPLEHIINFLKTTDELKTASILLKTFKKYANDINQYDQLGKLFNDVKDYHSAIECAENTLALAKSPQELYSVRCNLAKLYNSINEPLKALTYINANLAVTTDNKNMLMERVFALYLNGQQQESYELTKEILADPNTPQEVIDKAKFNLGSYLLDDNEFKQGLQCFIEVGHKIGIWPKTTFPGPQWDGSITPNATIAILAEGGIGDEVINIRFMKQIKELGMNPIFVTNRNDTLELFNRNNLPTVRTIKEVPEDAQWILSMYLPIALDLDYNQLWQGPYLTPDEQYVEKWKKILPLGKKVAIRWKGNEYYDQDLHRSIPLSEFNKALDFSRTDITFVSVQRENYDGIEQYPNVINVADQLTTLEDLLACLSLMDQTITSCTSIAHVAAAAGLPVTVCTPIATYYVWLGNSEWYGKNCRLIRQTKCKNWDHLSKIEV